MAGLSLAGLDINNTGQTVQLKNPLTVTGNVTLTDGTLTGPSNLTMNAAGTVNLFGGTLDTTFTMGAPFVQPSVAITAGSTQTNPFTITSNGYLDNFGNAILSGDGDHISNNGTIRNESGATFDIQSDVSIMPVGGSGSVGNSGTFQKSGGSASSIGGLAFTNSGDLLLKSGTLTINPRIWQTKGSMQLLGGNLASPNFDILLDGGTLSGGGQITCTKLKNESATVSPGLHGSPASITVTGDYEQDSGGTLVIAINQIGQYSFVYAQKNPNVAGSGNATLAGTLTVNKDPNYKPPYGQTLGIVGADLSVSGGFSIVSISNNEWYNGDTALYFIPLLNSNGKEFDLFATYYG